MLKWLGAGLFAALVAAVMFMPLAPVLARLAPGLEAETVSGSIWNGRLRGASYAGLALGDVDAGLDPRRLLAGEASIVFTRLNPRLSGRAGGTRADRRLEALTGELELALLPAPVPAAVIGFANVSLRLGTDGRCLAAGGDVTARLSGVPFLGETVALAGQPRCEGGALMVPLLAPGGAAGLDLAASADGRWQAGLRINSANPLAIAALAVAGFAVVPGGAVRTVEGRFGA